ncbi:MAG: hypothetical protein OZ919_12700 [Xanthomonadaceae bacterium]|nr:hypothetical protein [Xanthomonadaceae bacterium]
MIPCPDGDTISLAHPRRVERGGVHSIIQADAASRRGLIQALAMTRSIFLIVLFLTGCFGGLRHDYGTKYPEGELLTTSCVVVKSFAPQLRSAPQLHGADAFVGYYDYGPGMPRGHVFLVSPVSTATPLAIGELLQSADPRKRSFWLDATLTSGDMRSGGPFEALVPPKQHSPSPNSTIVEREAVLVRGQLRNACGKHYLVAVQGNPLGLEHQEWPRIRESYELFTSNLQWPQ